MAKRSKHHSDLLDCTKDCSCETHSSLILRVAHLGNVRLLQHCSTLCGNYLRIRDGLGRNALHVAASKGHLKLIRWLLDRGVSCNLADLESRWSPLHRSVFYGQLGAAVLLSSAGGDLKQKDSDGLTPLSLLNQDRERFRTPLCVDSVSVYTWGSNSNVTLGHDHSRNYPEKLELSHSLVITQVVLCKFHSVFLTECGKVLTCGHGLGGRLGHASEQSHVVPCVVKALEGQVCVDVAAARNHTVILSKSGSVFTFGLNDAHQLGLGSNPATAPQSSPQPKLVKALKNKRVVGIGAGRYHTAMCTQSEVYTAGKNLGQLGYEKNYDTQIAPRPVPGVNLDPDDVITHLSASDAATACLTKKCRIYVCTSYTVKIIRWGYHEKCSFLQFSVCSSLSDLDHLRKVETEPAKVFMLDSHNDLWYWQPTVKGSLPAHLPGLARLKVRQFSLGRNLSVVTKHGEVYSGSASLAKKPLVLTRMPNIQNAETIFTDFKSNNFTFTQQVYRAPCLPTLTRGSLSSDLTALLEEACLPTSVCDLEIEAAGQVFPCHQFVLSSVSPEALSLVNSAQDNRLTIKCDNASLFEAFLHYLYGSHIQLLPPHTKHSSQPLTSQSHSSNPSLPHTTHSSHPHTTHSSHLQVSVSGPLASGSSSGISEGSVEEDNTPDTSFNISIDDNDLTEVYDQFASSEAGVDSQFLDLPQKIPASVGASTPKKRKNSLYSGVVSSLRQGDVHKSLELMDIRADLKALHKLATMFGVVKLQKSLDDLLGSQRVLNKSLVLVCPTPSLQPTSEHSDLVLISEEGISLLTHCCVLVARSDYFRSMLLMGWKESNDSVSLPVPEDVLKAVLEFIYTDQCPAVTGSDSMEWVVNVMVVADQLLLTRLKEFCELAVASALSLRNVSEILELAETYSASQLKCSCLQFISANAAALLEGGLLSNLDQSMLEELSTTYKELAPIVTKRKIQFAEPETQALPESYFLEDTTNEGAKDVSDEESPAPTNSQFQSPAVSIESTTPRSTNSASGRRKRKRKSSQSGKVDPRSPPRTTPSPIPSILPSSEPPPVTVSSSLKENTPPSGTVWTEKVSRSARRSSGKARTKLISRFGTVLGDVIGTSPKESSGKGPKESSVSGPQESDRKRNLVNYHEHSFVTENSHKESGAGHKETVTNGTGGKVASTGGGPWAQLSSSNGSGSLRNIIAREEELERSKHSQLRQKSPPPAPTVASPGIPIARRESPVHSPITTSPSVNPWGGVASSPPVSLRELMMEAEATQRKEKQLQRQASSEARVSHSHQPNKVPHQQVSFASIVRSQEQEQDKSRLRSQKPLQLIQIEERAMLELEELYKAKDNPDEYITVRPMSGSTGGSVRQDTPWSKDPAYRYPCRGGVASSPPVSLKELMLEAEATQRKETQLQRQASSKARVSHSHQPNKVPHQQVSFASIVRSQEQEQDKSRLRSQKPLRLIQIEERAMLELEELYKAKDNPDEYITVRPMSGSTGGSVRQDTPWSKDPAYR